MHFEVKNFLGSICDCVKKVTNVRYEVDRKSKGDDVFETFSNNPVCLPVNILFIVLIVLSLKIKRVIKLCPIKSKSKSVTEEKENIIIFQMNAVHRMRVTVQKSSQESLTPPKKCVKYETWQTRCTNNTNKVV